MYLSEQAADARIVKLNYKCPLGTVSPGSFECPDTRGDAGDGEDLDRMWKGVSSIFKDELGGNDIQVGENPLRDVARRMVGTFHEDVREQVERLMMDAENGSVKYDELADRVRGITKVLSEREKGNYHAREIVREYLNYMVHVAKENSPETIKSRIEEADQEIVSAPPVVRDIEMRARQILDEGPDELRAVVKNYTGIDYETINWMLSGKFNKVREHSVEDVLRAMREYPIIKRAMDMSRAPDDIVLYRGVGYNETARIFGNYDHSLSEAVGRKVQIDVIQSTSWSENVARDFAKEKRGWVYELHVPKGSRVLSTMSCSKFPNEHEVLLPEGVTYEIYDVATSKGRTVVRARVRDPEANEQKHNARMVMRQVPVEHMVVQNGRRILESAIDDIMSALRDVGYFQASASSTLRSG